MGECEELDHSEIEASIASAADCWCNIAITLTDPRVQVTKRRKLVRTPVGVAIGFNKARTLAAVYSEAVCGSLCGHGKLRFLKLGPNGWIELTPPFPACDWIS